MPAITIEENFDDEIYFWHDLFGVVGCNNDITVLEESPLLGKFTKDSTQWHVSNRLME